jgi:hypothetical protein
MGQGDSITVVNMLDRSQYPHGRFEADSFSVTHFVDSLSRPVVYNIDLPVNNINKKVDILSKHQLFSQHG